MGSRYSTSGGREASRAASRHVDKHMESRGAARNRDGEFSVRRVGGLATQVLEFQTDTDDGNADDRTHVVFIPGNPGIVGAYLPFLKSLALSTHMNANLKITSMSYPGHDESGIPHGMEERGMYSLEEQIQHKLAFINETVPLKSKLVLIGHSLGCYMIMQLLKRNALANHRVVKVGLLCPVVANMAESPAGMMFGPLFKNHPYVGKALIHTASWLPTSFLHNRFEKAFVERLRTPDLYRSSLVSLVVDFLQRPHCVMNAVSIGVDSIDKLQELDVDTLQVYKDRCTIWYTPIDHWVPSGMYQTLAQRHKDFDIKSFLVYHAFMLHAADEVAGVVGPWLSDV